MGRVRWLDESSRLGMSLWVDVRRYHRVLASMIAVRIEKRKEEG